MLRLAPLVEPTVRRRVFQTWSVEIPAAFDETFVTGGSYWHVWDEHRSVSLTSVVLTRKRGGVTAKEILRRLLPLPGEPIDDLPPGLRGQAALAATDPPARASRCLSGILAAEGRLMLATVTSDDLDWARRVWCSLRYHEPPPSRRHERRSGKERRHGR